MPNVLSRCIAYVLEVLVASSVSTAPLFDEFVHLFSGKSMFTFFCTVNFFFPVVVHANKHFDASSEPDFC